MKKTIKKTNTSSDFHATMHECLDEVLRLPEKYTGPTAAAKKNPFWIMTVNQLTFACVAARRINGRQRKRA